MKFKDEVFELRATQVCGRKYVLKVAMKPKYRKLLKIAQKSKRWRVKKKNLLRLAKAMGYELDRGE